MPNAHGVNVVGSTSGGRRVAGRADAHPVNDDRFGRASVHPVTHRLARIARAAPCRPRVPCHPLAW
jgi:hypothetical protein